MENLLKSEFCKTCKDLFNCNNVTLRQVVVLSRKQSITYKLLNMQDFCATCTCKNICDYYNRTFPQIRKVCMLEQNNLLTLAD